MIYMSTCSCYVCVCKGTMSERNLMRCIGWVKCNKHYDAPLTLVGHIMIMQVYDHGCKLGLGRSSMVAGIKRIYGRV